MKFEKQEIKLNQLNQLKFDQKFDIFYKFRFHNDYLQVNIDQKKISKKNSKEWFRINHRDRKIFAIVLNKKIIGLIIYNINNFFYSILILKKYRNKRIGTIALVKFVAILKKKKIKLVTMVKKSNKNSVYLHKKLFKNYKSINKNFFYFKIL
jgi:hypothetical protein